MSLRVMKISAATALAMLAAPQLASAASGTVTASVLNLRSCASVGCATVMAIPAGARVSIDGATGGWYHLTYNGVSGYASSRYVYTGAEITVTGHRAKPLSEEISEHVPLPPGPAPFGYQRTQEGHFGTWYQPDAFFHDSYKVDDPAILFGFSIPQ